MTLISIIIQTDFYNLIINIFIYYIGHLIDDGIYIMSRFQRDYKM